MARVIPVFIFVLVLLVGVVSAQSCSGGNCSGNTTITVITAPTAVETICQQSVGEVAGTSALIGLILTIVLLSIIVPLLIGFSIVTGGGVGMSLSLFEDLPKSVMIVGVTFLLAVTVVFILQRSYCGIV